MTQSTTSLFPALSRTEWWGPFAARRDASASHTDLPVALAAAGHPDPAEAVAYSLLAFPSVLSAYATSRIPDGLRGLVRAELWHLAEHLRRVLLASNAADPAGQKLVLRDLAAPHLDQAASARVGRLASALVDADADGVTATFLALLQEVGNGPAALYPTLSWRAGRLEPVRHPDTPGWEALVDLAGPLDSLAQNTEAFVLGRRVNDCLLYGARGSGKSTAVRGLAPRYAGAGLRLVEVPPHELEGLPVLVEELRPQPLKFVLFVDDLAFEDGDTGYGPLKSLLDGGVRRRPDNTVVYATSNRRHLVRERLKDRPDLLDDDVHAWDTQHERLALADRFGRVITFPAADQRRYLGLVRRLALAAGVEPDAELEGRALRFAEWNNHYSGRTAKQFVATLAPGPDPAGW